MAQGQEEPDGRIAKGGRRLHAEDDDTVYATVWPLRRTGTRLAKDGSGDLVTTYAEVLLGPADENGKRPVLEGELKPGERVIGVDLS